jgi:hypothetical protein
MARELFGLSLGFAALILITTHAQGAERPGLTRLPPLPIAVAATPAKAPR